jgi:peptidoglycan/xylan/chitin deacetylase (PgdA/CDA1 family)
MGVTAVVVALFVGLQLLVSTKGYKFALYNVDNPSEKNVALTFDDGPHGTLTPRLLDTLKQVSKCCSPRCRLL